MAALRPTFDLYLITPGAESDHILRACEAALHGAPAGRVALQLRAPHLTDAERAALASALRVLTRRVGVPLLISGDLALAAAVDADGVQLPERGPEVGIARRQLGARALLGASRHDLPGLQRAQEQDASFATLSPVFPVEGKGAALGIDGLGCAARAVGVPVFALGGVRSEHAATLVAAGAHGVAIIRQVFGADDPGAAVLEFVRALDRGRAVRARAC